MSEGLQALVKRAADEVEELKRLNRLLATNLEFERFEREELQRISQKESDALIRLSEQNGDLEKALNKCRGYARKRKYNPGLKGHLARIEEICERALESEAAE